MTLMSARHRLSKVLLRHGHVYDGGDAWTGKHDAWLRRIRKEELIGGGVETVAHGGDPAPWLPAWDLDHDRVPKALAAVEIGDWRRLSGSSIGSSLG